ncbi:MAG: 4Fe-4S dicluster domain-containing protein [Promethearchaeati archaeon]
MSKRFGFVIDQERCIGCDACTVACRIEHNADVGFIIVDTTDSALKDVPSGNFPNLRISWIPKLCNHCENPPCLKACPVNAIYKREDGIVIIDDDLCDGCRTCVDACPYGVIYFNEKESLAEKCNLCAHRIDQGLEPFCVICCEGQAIYFGDFNDSNSKVSRIISEKEVFRLKEDLGTNPIIYYVPPMEKREL